MIDEHQFNIKQLFNILKDCGLEIPSSDREKNCTENVDFDEDAVIIPISTYRKLRDGKFEELENPPQPDNNHPL
ncbi:MAG: hypothetical protein JXR95_01680 [Deltaproteobacteria bacterium]|nr:hypothetical protein [Deltaproteobacteria bacterium]